MAGNLLGQICERKFGDPECPFHPGNNVISSCEECMILVCLDCITSEKHKGHSFCKIEEYLNVKRNDFGQFNENLKLLYIPQTLESINEIEKNITSLGKNETILLEKVCDRFNQIFGQLTSVKQLITEDVTSFFAEQKQQFETLKEKLISNKAKLECLSKDFQQTFDSGTSIEQFDASQCIQKNEEITKAMVKIPPLKGLELVIEDDNVLPLLNTLLGEMQYLFFATHSNLNIELSSTTFNNEMTLYHTSTPFSEDKAWCAVRKYDKDSKTYCTTNYLCLINKKGIVQQKVQTSSNIRGLCLHPQTGVLYGTFDDKTVCTIDTNTGTTNIVLALNCTLFNLTITSNGDIFLGEYWENRSYIYKYSCGGQLSRQSKDKYNVWDISYSDVNDHVAIACGTSGVVIIDGTLTNKIHKLSMRCITATYNRDGNLVIGDWDMKAIHILDGKTFSTNLTFTPPDMSTPGYIRLFDKAMWVQCMYPRKIVHVTSL